MAITVPTFSRILEASIYAADIGAAEAFYGNILGLPRIVRVGNRHVFFRVGDTILLIFNPSETARPTANTSLPVPPHGAEGAGHVCLAAIDDEMHIWKERLVANSVGIEADFHWPNGARSIYFRDPAGNSVEIAERHLWEEPLQPSPRIT